MAMETTRRAFERRHVVLLLASDVGSCVAAVLAAYGLRFVTPEAWFGPLAQPLTMYLKALPVVLALWVVVFEGLGLYRVSRIIRPFHDLFDTFHAVTLATILVAAVSFLSLTNYSRAMLFLFWGVGLVLVGTGRSVLSGVRERALRAGVARSRTAIVGRGELAQLIARRLQSHPELGYEPIGFVQAHADGAEETAEPCLGTLAELPQIVAGEHVDEVIVAHLGLGPGELLAVVGRCEHLPVEFRVLAGPFEVLTGQAVIEGLTDLPTIELRQRDFPLWAEAVKRLADLLLAALLMVVLSPLWLVLAVLVRRQTGVSALFRQVRVGHYGRDFVMYKFRSMREDSDPYAPSPDDPGDPRITPIGRWMRRFSLDEMPQLLNVLRGDMSLVGPRPEMRFIVDRYEPWQMRRLDAKPGLTGLWQILGRKDLPLTANIEYDFYYIRNRSLLLDLAIVLRTIPLVVRGKGAY